jgi:hypothetical protein
MFTGDDAVQSKLLYRGYQLEVRRAPSGWRVGIYPRTKYVSQIAVRSSTLLAIRDIWLRAPKGDQFGHSILRG